MFTHKIVNGERVELTPQEIAEHEAKAASALAEQARTQYKTNRADEYPSIGDQLDALWKGGTAATEMLAQVQAVKAKYPKSE